MGFADLSSREVIGMKAITLPPGISVLTTGLESNPFNVLANFEGSPSLLLNIPIILVLYFDQLIQRHS